LKCYSKIIEKHGWLLSESVDLLPKLLLPLAGPEEFDEEDNDKLPIDLQYLGEEKSRERDPDIRKIIVEALTQVIFDRLNLTKSFLIFLFVSLSSSALQSLGAR
jgi:hypothetical protein